MTTLTKNRLGIWIVGLMMATLTSSTIMATETENQSIRILKAAGPVAIDGKTDDWNLSGGTFACKDVKRFRDTHAIWIHLMHDADNLYLMARWIDPTPLNNPNTLEGGHGWAGDCLQFRIIVDPDTDNERVTHLTLWKDPRGKSAIRIDQGRKFDGHPGNEGCAQAFLKTGDHSYNQEFRIPWKLLTVDGKRPGQGSIFKATVEPNFTAGPLGRLSIKDLLYDPTGRPDRIFTFRAYKCWGKAKIVDEIAVKPQSLRLAGGQELPVAMEDGKPVVDWSGIMEKKELPGHVKIDYTMPFDGEISMIIRNEKGEIVRQLLGGLPVTKGKHSVNWDGLTTPFYKIPGQVLPAGNYTWEAMAHKPFSLTLRGWANSHGIPWSDGPATQWGGDHGQPACIARSPYGMVLGWDGAEAGVSVIGVDLDGNMKWKILHGAGHYPRALAISGEWVVGLDNTGGRGSNLFLLEVKNGRFGFWGTNNQTTIKIQKLWEQENAPTSEAYSLPKGADTMDAVGKIAYLGFARQSIELKDFTDIKKTVTWVLSDAPLAKEMLGYLTAIHKAYPAKLARYLKDGNPRNLKANWAHVFNKEFPKLLSKWIQGELDKNPSTQDNPLPFSEVAKRRQTLEKAMQGVLKPLRSSFILGVDVPSGKITKVIDIPFPTAVKAVNADQLYVISDQSKLLSLNPKTGKYTEVLSAPDMENLTVAENGDLYIAYRGKAQQVVVYSPKGKKLRSIGKTGGRPLLGPWNGTGMLNPTEIELDSMGRLWVMERDRHPKRVSVWNTTTGKLETDMFGPTLYGNSGAAIDSLDPNLMISGGCEWQLDPSTGKAKLIGVFQRRDAMYAQFAHVNGRTYVAGIYSNRKTGTIQLLFLERLKPGVYKERAHVQVVRSKRETTFWADANDNGIVAPGEETVVPDELSFSGMWWYNLNLTDFSLIALGNTDPNLTAKEKKTQQHAYQFRVKGYTDCGAPIYDTKNPTLFDYAIEGRLRPGNLWTSPKQRLLATINMGNRTTNLGHFEIFDTKTKKVLMSYPNTFEHVHGSHRSPPPVPGLMRGAFGIVGTFMHDKLGRVFAVNGNCGEWYLLSESGYYVSKIFQGDMMRQHFPKNPKPGSDMTLCPPGLGGEDFGGMLTQTPDGSVYIEAGKVGAWNLKLGNLDTVAFIGKGTINLSEQDVALAKKEHDQQLQAAKGGKIAEVATFTPKQLTGNIGADFRGVKALSYKKQEGAGVRTAISWDDKNLYLAYQVEDNTPWENGATDPASLYVCGDTVDFQFGSDPKAKEKRRNAESGDLRISIGNLKGKPTAMLYRPKSTVKQPKTFTSSVIPEYIMDYVAPISDARIEVKVDKKKSGYTVEAAIPWKSLGFTPQKSVVYKGDVGVTHGNDAADRTRLRSYWNNQQTGLVDDAVFEVKLTPMNWGKIIFK